MQHLHPPPSYDQQYAVPDSLRHRLTANLVPSINVENELSKVSIAVEIFLQSVLDLFLLFAGEI